jgi:hypothetical protein
VFHEAPFAGYETFLDCVVTGPRKPTCGWTRENVFGLLRAQATGGRGSGPARMAQRPNSFVSSLDWPRCRKQARRLAGGY